MKHVAVALALGAVLTAPACAAEVVAVEIAPVSSDAVVEGDAVELVVRVANVSKDSVVVVGEPDSRYGALNKATGHADALFHETMAQQETPAVFYSFAQVLLPGDRWEERVKVDALQDEVAWSPKLVVHDVATFRPYLPSVVSMTRKIYERGGESAIRKKRERPSDGDLVPGKLPEKAFEDYWGYGMAILEPGRAETVVARAKIALAKRPFSLSAAREKLGAPADLARWSRAAGGWVFASAARTAIVREGAVVELPAGSFGVLADADATPGNAVVFRADPVPEALAKIAKPHAGDGMYRRGTFVDIPASRVVEALEAARAAKLSIERTTSFHKSWFYELKPAG